MEKLKIKLILVILVIAVSSTVFAQKEVKKTFTAKNKIKISLVSGDCIIKKADSDQFNIKLTYTYSDDCFKYSFKENADCLEVKEDFDGNCSGESNWEISVPETTEVTFNSASGNLIAGGIKNGLSSNTASGNLEIDGIGGKIEINTASGNVLLGHANGDLDLNTASGDVSIKTLSGNLQLNTASGDVSADVVGGKSKITTASGNVSINAANDELTVSVASGNVMVKNSKGKSSIKSASGDIELINGVGAFEIKTASGSIKAEGIELTGISELMTASGDVMIKLAKAAAHDMNLSTASGEIELNYNGNEISGYFEFTARKDKGKIISPVKFDKEEVIEIDGKDYDKKSFTKGAQAPKIILKTSSGTLKLVK